MADANPFSQFDNLRWSPNDDAVITGSGRLYAAPQSPDVKPADGENPFARFDSLRGDNPSRSPTLRSIAEQVPTGFNETTADVLGAPVDAMTWALNKGIHGINTAAKAAGYNQRNPSDLVTGAEPTPLISDIQHPFGGSESIKRGMAAVGVPNPDDVPAQNAAERIARGAGGGVAAMIAPEAALGTLARTGAVTPGLVEGAAKVFGRSNGVGDVAKAATVGATSGATGEGAAELSPDQYKPAVRAVGSLAGGGVGALAAEGPRAVVQAARGAKDFVAPLTEEGRAGLAADRLAGRAEDLPAVKEKLADQPGELVPGSQPTTFQATGDMGLGSLEREVASKNPADFMQRRADQNAARVDALRGVQPTGNPEDVSSALRSHLAEIDQQSHDAVERATAAAQGKAATLGGDKTPEYYGQRISEEVAPLQNTAVENVRGGVQALGGGGTPEGYGASLRGALQSAEDSARSAERGLWKAVDPDGKLTVSMVPVQGAVNQVYGNLTATGKATLSPIESTILKVVDGYRPVEPFRELADLRSAVSAGMRSELSTSGRSPAYARLKQLRGAVEDSISGAVEGKATQEAQAVARGEMSPEQTAAARLMAQREAWYAQRNAATGLGQSAAGDAGADAVSRSRGISSVSRDQGEKGNGLRNSERNQSLQETGSEPNFDEAARERLNAATTATRERAQTYNQGPVGQALRSSGMQGQYRTLDAAVPSAIFKPGAPGFESVQAFRRAVGNDPTAVDTLRNFAASSLRHAAEQPDGTLDPRKFWMWRRQYQEAIRALPELSRSFDSLEAASKALERFSPFRPDIAPSSLPEQFFHSGPSGFEGVNQLRQIIGDQEAQTILGDYAASRLRTAAMRPDGVLDPAKFATWRKSHADALRALPGLEGRFSDAAKATEAIAEAASARRAALDEYQQGAIGKLLNLSDPQDVVRTVGNIFGKSDAVSSMRALARETASDPAAREGLRKAIVDYIYGRFIGNTEAATSEIASMKPDAFQTFIRQNIPVLEQVFPTTNLNALRAIAADLSRANRSLNAVRIPGQSNTVQDMLPHLETHGEHGSVLTQLMVAAAGGYEVHGVPGAALGLLGVMGKSVVGRARDAGLAKVDDLVKQAMLNPDVARYLLGKVSAKPETRATISLAQQLRRLSVFEPMSWDKQREGNDATLQ